MLAVAAKARALAATLAGEVTLPRELRTPPLPEAHVPVGYCWQNSRCCQPPPPPHSYISDFVSHPNLLFYPVRGHCSTIRAVDQRWSEHDGAFSLPAAVAAGAARGACREQVSVPDGTWS